MCGGSQLFLVHNYSHQRSWMWVRISLLGDSEKVSQTESLIYTDIKQIIHLFKNYNQFIKGSFGKDLSKFQRQDYSQVTTVFLVGYKAIQRSCLRHNLLLLWALLHSYVLFVLTVGYLKTILSRPHFIKNLLPPIENQFDIQNRI